MYSTVHDEFPQRDVDASDLDAERASSNRIHRLRPDSAYRSSGFKNAQVRSDRPSVSRRLTRSLASYSIVGLLGVGATLAWQSYGGEMVRAWAPSLGWLLPASQPGPAVTSAELQQQLKPMAIDIALVRRSEEQLAANQDQLARKQDQMTQAIATLQAAEQDLSQKILSLAPPAPKAANVPPPKPLQPAAR
jgi:uncharacterized iron-regulated membrane protein